MSFHRAWNARLAAALIAVLPAAQAGAAGDLAGYLTTADGQAVTDSSRECWHTGEWKPGMRFANCEPRAVKAAAAVSKPPKAALPALKAAATPSPAKPAPQPAPTPFRLSADALFDFDSAMLKPQGRAALDRLEDRIAHAAYRSVQITGHADRLGAPSYNGRLSDRRAQAVRDYLVAKGLDRRKISAEGVGSTEPVTTARECDGVRGTRLIQCLQPDRYAEVTVLATEHAASARW